MKKSPKPTAKNAVTEPKPKFRVVHAVTRVQSIFQVTDQDGNTLRIFRDDNGDATKNSFINIEVDALTEDSFKDAFKRASEFKNKLHADLNKPVE